MLSNPRFVRPRDGLRLAVVGFLAASLVPAQEFTLDWFTLDGGAGVASGGAYQIAGTIGQPDAGGVLTGGRFSFIGGFWGAVELVQSPEGPRLSIAAQEGGVRIFWPSPSAGYRLQRSPDLSLGIWSDAGAVPLDNGVQKSILILPATGSWFYRLTK